MKRRALVGLLAGIGIPNLASAQETLEEKNRRKEAWDEEIITLVLTDILTDPKSPLEVAVRGPKKGIRKVYFELEDPKYRPGLLDVFREKDSGDWEKLSEARWDSARAAGRHMQRRASDKKAVAVFTPAEKRLIRTSTKLAKGKEPTVEHITRQVFKPLPPGYSPDSSLAVVFMQFTWAGGYHAADATYLLERRLEKWQILAHDHRLYP